MKTIACRICEKAPLTAVLDYGRVALADGFLDPAAPTGDEPTYPLALCVCEACGHLQIDEIVDPALLFRDYIYLTGVSDTVRAYARALRDEVLAVHGGGADLRVVEAASNDGTVLAAFQERGATVLGVDPARNIARIAEERGVPTVAEFWNRETAAAVAKRLPDADLFLARNVLAHVADLHGFVAGIGAVLAANGIGVIEVPHALTMFDHLEYDQVFHEHIGYYTVDSLQKLFAPHGLSVFRVEEIALHGGSVRVYLAREGVRPEHPSVQRVVGEEHKKALHTAAAWRAFADRVGEQRRQLREELARLKREGKRIAAYGASGKGQAMLQFCGIDRASIDFVVDKSPWKQGKLTPGTHIPVLPTEKLLEAQPDVVLLSAWNFADEIRAQQSEYVRRGGRMLHPLPLPHYIP